MPKPDGSGGGGNGGGGNGGGGKGGGGIEFLITGLTEGSDLQDGSTTPDNTYSYQSGFKVAGTLDPASADTLTVSFSLSDGSQLEFTLDDGDTSTTLADSLDGSGNYTYTDADWTFTLTDAGDWTLTYTGADVPNGTVQVDASHTAVNPKNGKIQTKTAPQSSFEIDAAAAPNNAVVITGEDLLGGVAEDTAATLTDTGTIGFDDADTSDAHDASASFTSTSHSSQLGVLTASVTTDTTGSGTGGIVTWDYSVADADVQFLNAGETITEIYTVTLTDNQGSTVTRDIEITITGADEANTPASISGQATGGVTEDTNLATGGTLTVIDPDPGEDGLQAQGPVVRSYGTFNVFADGTWTYDLDNSNADVQALIVGADPLIDTLTVWSADGTASETLIVTVLGTNDAAVISGTSTGAVTEDDVAPAMGALSVTDPDAGQAALQAVAAGTAGDNGYGTFEVLSDGTWAYTVDNTSTAVQALITGGATLDDTITVWSADGGTSQEITVTINGQDDAAITGGVIAGSVTEDGTLVANGALTITDPDAGEEAFSALNQLGDNGHGTFVVAADGTWSYTLDNSATAVQDLDTGATLSDQITVTSADGSSSETITITIHGTDEPDPGTNPIVPTVGIPDLLAASDTGTSDSDDITGLSSVDFSIALVSDVEIGDTVLILVDGLEAASHVVTSTDLTNGAVTLGAVALGSNGTKRIEAQISDGLGGVSTSGARVVTVDAAHANGSTIDLLPDQDNGNSDADNTINVSPATLRVYLDPTVIAGHYVGFYIDGAQDTVLHILEQSDIDQGFADLPLGTTLVAGANSIIARIGTQNVILGIPFGWRSFTDTEAIVLEMDLTPPDVAITDILGFGAPIVGGITTDDTPELIGTADVGSTVTIRYGSTIYGSTQADQTGAWSFVITDPLEDKEYNFAAEATDEFGNAGLGFRAVEIDTGPEPAGPPPEAEPQFLDQWHLAALGDIQTDWTDFSGIQSVWEDYTGAGVLVAIYDDGVEYDHVDLDHNFSWKTVVTVDGVQIDPYPFTGSGANHGTAVSGVIAAEANGQGTVGIAHGADLYGINIFSGPAFVNAAGNDLDHGFFQAIEQQYLFDVVNHSWGGLPLYLDDDPSLAGSVGIGTVAGFEIAVETGRGGLGTLIFKSAGNWSDSANGSLADASRYSITVAAFDSTGDASWYTNRGANILVTAASSGLTSDGDLRIPTTDRVGEAGYVSGDWSTTGPGGFGGTSSSSPTAAAVGALMLEAGPTLGWRDAQDILAYSAMHIGSAIGVQNMDTQLVPADLDNNATFESEELRLIEYFAGTYTGVTNANGGGLGFVEDYGFGAVDVHAAVRMAEIWHLFGAAETSANEEQRTVIFADADPVANPLLSVSGNGSSQSTALAVATDAMELDYVEVTIELVGIVLEEAELTITSASGTMVTLFTPEINDYTPVFTFGVSPIENNLAWTFGIQAFKGEDPNGDWTVTLTERDTNYDMDNFGGEQDGITLRSVTLDFYGDVDGLHGVSLDDDVYHYTDEVLDLIAIDASRETVTDLAGTDWLNLAAITGDVVLTLNSAGTVSYGGGPAESFVQFGAGTVIEHVVAGDGNDLLTGDGGDNQILGMRGSDVINGGAGDDTLTGGQDDDDFVFIAGFGTDRITDFSSTEGDMIDFTGVTEISDFAGFSAATSQVNFDLHYDFGADNTDVLIFEGIMLADLSDSDFIFA